MIDWLPISSAPENTLIDVYSTLSNKRINDSIIIDGILCVEANDAFCPLPIPEQFAWFRFPPEPPKEPTDE